MIFVCSIFTRFILEKNKTLEFKKITDFSDGLRRSKCKNEYLYSMVSRYLIDYFQAFTVVFFHVRSCIKINLDCKKINI